MTSPVKLPPLPPIPPETIIDESADGDCIFGQDVVALRAWATAYAEQAVREDREALSNAELAISCAKCGDDYQVCGHQAIHQCVLAALESAQRFIRNGVEFGYVRMPDADTPDPAHRTPGLIDAAIRALSAQKKDPPC